MILEMRVYRCLPGRLPNLLKRFEDHTLKIWEKHGIRQAGFFTTVIGQSNQELTYFLNWDSLAEREQKAAVMDQKGAGGKAGRAAFHGKRLPAQDGECKPSGTCAARVLSCGA